MWFIVQRAFKERNTLRGQAAFAACRTIKQGNENGMAMGRRSDCVCRLGRDGRYAVPAPLKANEQPRQRVTRASIRDTKAPMRLSAVYGFNCAVILPKCDRSRARHQGAVTIRAVALNDPGSSRHAACPLLYPLLNSSAKARASACPMHAAGRRAARVNASGIGRLMRMYDPLHPEYPSERRAMCDAIPMTANTTFSSIKRRVIRYVLDPLACGYAR
jgi:hypothetical protein